MRRAGPLLVTALVLVAGCLTESADPPAGGGPDARTADMSGNASASRILGWHLAHPGPAGGNATILAVHANGSATRLTARIVDDYSTWAFAPSVRVDLPHPYALHMLFTEFGARDAHGGFIGRMETGALPAAARAELEDVLATPWPQDAGAYGDVRHVLVRAPADGAPEVAAAPPAAEGVQRVLDAFAAANAAFTPEHVVDAWDELPPDGPPCVDVTMDVDRAAIRPGEPLTMEVTLESCEERTLTLGAPGCGTRLALAVSATVTRADGTRESGVLPPADAATAAFPHGSGCRAPDPPALTLEPGTPVTVTRAWNGTLARCDAADACAFEPAPHGEHTLHALVSFQEYPAFERVFVLHEDGPHVRLLHVREHAWANATSADRLPGDFGPHCAPARLDADARVVTLTYYEGEPPSPVGLVLRDWRGSDRSSFGFSSGRDALPVDGARVTLASPFDADVPLADVRLDGDAFIVNGTRLAPGDSLTLRVEHAVVRDGTTYDTTHVLELENAGRVALLTHKAGGCA